MSPPRSPSGVAAGSRVPDGRKGDTRLRLAWKAQQASSAASTPPGRGQKETPAVTIRGSSGSREISYLRRTTELHHLGAFRGNAPPLPLVRGSIPGIWVTG